MDLWIDDFPFDKSFYNLGNQASNFHDFNVLQSRLATRRKIPRIERIGFVKFHSEIKYADLALTDLRHRH
jgi:hypothetical protein